MKISEANTLNFFDGEELKKFYKSLPFVGDIQNHVLEIEDPVAIMTHDDCFDQEFEDFEQQNGFASTTFVLHDRIDAKCLSCKSDIQFHYNKESELLIKDQINEFVKKTNKKPRINRNHRLWWRESHLDLAHLAMNKIEVDSTLVGIKPFRLIAEQRLLPIWEVPFCITDHGAVSVENSASCAHNLAKDMKTLFKRNTTPIVALFHPYLKEKSNWKDFFLLAEKHNYKLMNMSEFKDRYLKIK